jgi:hypothetical protein
MALFDRFPSWAIVLAILIVPGGTLLAPALLLKRRSLFVGGAAK